MNTQQKIDKLTDELRVLKLGQRLCEHKWGETEYNPYQGYESYATGNYDKQGIHMTPIMDSRIITKKRWTRICSVCGLPEHTEKEVEIKQPVKTEPKFS